MGALSSVAKAAPAFFTKNRLNSDAFNAGAIAVLSGDAFKYRAYDMTGSGWSSQGSSDSITEFYDFSLYDGATLTPQLVDTIILWGMNAKSFVIRYYYNGPQVAAVTVASYALPYYVLTGLNDGNGNPVIIDRVRVEVTTTQVANQEKVLNIFVGALILQPKKADGVTPFGMASYAPKRVDNIRTVRMADGTLYETAIYRSDSSFELWSCKMQFKGAPPALRASLKALKLTRPLVVMPEPGEAPQDIFLARVMPSGYDEQYLALEKNAGYDINISLEEIGGA